MLTTFHNKIISSIYTVLPSKQVNFMDEASNYAFTESQMRKLQKVMGFGTRRLAVEGETVSDYAVLGIQKMLDERVFTEKEIGAIIVTTTSPDHFIPPISNIVQGKFNFDEDTVCVDISQGCCGYVVGLVYSFMTLDSLKNKKVILISGDLLSFKVSTRDRASRPITGDAVSISVVENTADKPNTIYCSIKNDGKDAFDVYIPAGGTRIPITSETIQEKEDEFGNWRGLQHLVMQGDKVFNIIINKTPEMLDELLNESGCTIEDIDFFICHQSSSFTLKKLSQHLGVDERKLPRDIVPKYGNSSSATIPVTLCEHFIEIFPDEKAKRIVFAAFGTGMSLGAVLIELPRFKACKFIEK